MVSESSTIGVLSSKQTAQQNPSLLQDKELTTKFSPQNKIFPASKLTSFHNEPQSQTSRKRPRISEQQPSFQQPVATNPNHLGLSDKGSSRKQDFHFGSWPNNFTFQSNGVNKSVQQWSETKQPSFSVKNHQQLLGKTSTSGVGMNLSNASLFALDGFNVGSEKTEVDFSKAIEDAINRIESLIPSLQRLVKNDHSLEQKSVDHSAIPLGKEKDLVATKELRFTDNSAALGGTMLSKQGGQMLTKFNFSAPSQIEWNRMKGFELQKNSNAQLNSQVPEPMFKAAFGSSESVKGKLSKNEPFASHEPMFKADFGRSESLKGKLSRDGYFPSHEPMFKADFGKPESLKGKLSRDESFANREPMVKPDFGRSESLKSKLSGNGSFASHASKHVQGSRLMPHQYNRADAIGREVALSPCTQVQSTGSTSSMRRNRTSYTPPSHQKWSQSHTSGRIAQEMGQTSKMVWSRDSLSRTKGPLVAPHDQISEETSWNSYTSSDSTAQQSGSPSYSSGSYESSGSDGYDSDESEPLQVGYSRRMKQTEFTDSTASGYADTSSYSNSRDDYSEAKSSSQMSSARIHKWDPKKERGKRRGRLKRLGRKLGVIFHHHHHHHHHHYRDELDPHHARPFWKRLGEMFHHSRNANHHQKRKPEKPMKSDVKAVAKRKQQGHFHALVNGLMKHMKHSKKPKQFKNGFEGLGSGRHGGKKKGKKLLWWPKGHGGRGGVKVSNKGKVRLGNYRTKSFAAAKMILKK